ncbi:hypothetical protein DEO72_LG3g476 [Vigna unguiculata]|uniref:Uncharacterized protein n=1 Tax=Vigna unguiculata TaxID=3917 RepID=A0A4D6LC58_VIGUN|nr:hypothetical protein DEO72_LG3g476 [Vigna unguiculata]
MEGTAVVAAKEERLRLHVDAGDEGGDFISEEDGGGTEMFAHAVAHHTSRSF